MNASTLNEMALSQLLPDHPMTEAGAVRVRGLNLDSRTLQPGEAFVALAGAQHDGRDYISQALESGAVAVLLEPDRQWPQDTTINQVPVLAIPDLPARLSAIAGRFYGEPSAQVPLVGITGTNGKTSCALLLAQLSALLQGRAGVLGTLGYALLDGSAPMDAQINSLARTGLTTPDAISVQRILADLVAGDARTITMEVSSHSLVQNRVAGLNFSRAIFTNLTHDHLDYHGDMASYARAKEQLLTMPGIECAIVNKDDAWAAGLLERLPAGVKGLSYSVTDLSADIHLSDRVDQRSGVSALLRSPWGEGELHTSLLGHFNLSNLLAVIAAACEQGLPLAEVLNFVPHLQAAPGRMQPVVVDHESQDIQVIVDYAHTPDALKNTLEALQFHNTGRLWCVFGCGGDRDTGKRPAMGKLAEQYSDYVIVTNDNPRTEDPAQIAADIVRGMDNSNRCLIIADRAQAIDLAVQQARSGDTLLIAGKGHEDYQIFAGETLDFSDLLEARKSLERRIEKRRAGVAS